VTNIALIDRDEEEAYLPNRKIRRYSVVEGAFVSAPP